MNISEIKITEAAFDEIGAILSINFGEISLKTLTEETFYIFLATTIEASYRVGFKDGSKINSTP